MKISPQRHRLPRAARAFTMIEIAICLAIIGFALIGIIAALPLGMNTQRDNRQDTLIGQDANLLIELIRSGSRGADDLTNYVIAVTNWVDLYDGQGSRVKGYTNYYTPYQARQFDYPLPERALTNGANIIGLLSTPEFYTNTYGTISSFHPLPNVYQGGYSNRVVVYIRSISGLAAEKPPQNNDIMRDDAFTYRVVVVNAPVAQDSNTVYQAYNQNLREAMRELRMTFLWPFYPNGRTGPGRQTFRTSIAGDLHSDPFRPGLFYYQPQTFTPTTP